MEEEITFLRDQVRLSVLEVLMRDVGAAEWKQAESNWSLGYNKQSLRKKQLDQQKAKKAEEENQKLRARWVLNLDNDKASYLLWSSASANLMWSFVTIKLNQLTSPLSASGNIRQCTGWMHTEVGRMLKMLRLRWRSSAQGNTAHTGRLQRLGQKVQLDLPYKVICSTIYSNCLVVQI